LVVLGLGAVAVPDFRILVVLGLDVGEILDPPSANSVVYCLPFHGKVFRPFLLASAKADLND
jgi:hypothetical protein